MKDKLTISNQAHELRYFAKKFNCTTLALHIAKALAGNSVNSVEEQINEMRHNSENITHLMLMIPVDKLFKKEGGVR